MFWRKRKASDFGDEIEAHIHLETERLREQGLSEEDARAAARRSFGNVTQAQERFYESGRWLWFDHLWQDVRYGARMLRKSPGFTAVAVFTLALGIGANTTIFSWINSILLDPIPGVKHTSEYVQFTAGAMGQGHGFSYLDYRDLRDRNTSFSSLIAYGLSSMYLTGNEKPERVWGQYVSENYFDALGVRPFLGRGFLPAEGDRPGGAPVAVISYRLWETRFGSDQQIVGKSIEINKHRYTMIGVSPPVFQGTQTGLRDDLWLPVVMVQQSINANADKLQDRGADWLAVIAHLKPGVRREQAQAEFNTLYGQIARQFPSSHKDEPSVALHPLWNSPGGTSFIHTILLLLMAICGVVLLLACANVANLLLVRSVVRRREMAIRLSIGATRWRLVRQLLAESLILSLCGGGIAMLLTSWTAGTLADFIPPTELPVSVNVHVDRAVLFAALAISLLTAVIFGILPALRSSSLQPVAILKDESGSAIGGRRKARLSNILVVGQIAVSLLLLVCAGLFIRSFRLQQQFNPGFNPRNVLLNSYSLVFVDDNRGLRFHRDLLAKIQLIPGVEAAALASWTPLGFDSADRTIVTAEGYVAQRHESMEIEFASVSPDYVRTMRIQLVSGREFTSSDTDKSQPVAIVNQAFAQRYWPNQDAVGKSVQAESKGFMVVGVSQNIDSDHLGQEPTPFLYLPLFQHYAPLGIIHARVTGDPLAYVGAVQSAVHELNADVPLFNLMTLDSRIALDSTTSRIGGVIVGAFGVLALTLAAVGIFGVSAYTTRQRTQEFGLRMALGATPRALFSLVLRQGAILGVLGIAIGLAASLALTRALSAVLFRVSATDPLTYTGVAFLLLAVAFIACYIPARRAMRVDPIVALRYE